MKKALTKIAATLSAALLGALPMANSLSASAANCSGVKTYRTYVYYSGGATQTRRVDVEFYTNNPLKVKGNARTTGGWTARKRAATHTVSVSGSHGRPITSQPA